MAGSLTAPRAAALEAAAERLATRPACIAAAAVAIYVHRTAGATDVALSLAVDSTTPARTLRVTVRPQMTVGELVATVARETERPRVRGEERPRADQVEIAGPLETLVRAASGARSDGDSASPLGEPSVAVRGGMARRGDPRGTRRCGGARRR